MLHATAVAAAATAMSQIVAAPLDVGTRAAKACTTAAHPNVLSALFGVIRTHGWQAAFKGLPLHFVKRLPTKALTVALFELGTQALSQRVDKLSAGHHVGVAVSSGVAALLATYPIHLAYYAMRKGATFASILQCAKMQPNIVYSGAIPALLSTAPAVLVDYLMYKTLRERIDDGAASGQSTGMLTASAIVAAAAASNLTGGFFSEPFKALSRKMAVESVRSASCGSLAGTAQAMMQAGVGEFWRGFPVRSMRYALSAVVSKTTVQQLRRLRLPAGDAMAIFSEPRVSLVPARRALHAGRWQGQTGCYRASSGAVRKYRNI